MITSTSDAPIVWRRLQPDLWVGRSAGRHIGTIEQGRRFAFIDPTGAVHPGYRTLDAAQLAAAGAESSAVVPPARAAAATRSGVLLVIAASTTIGTVVVAVVERVFAG